MDYQVRTIWNVIATIKGEVEPDKWVMIGNHRDAWVYGAVDPGSGTAATLEMAGPWARPSSKAGSPADPGLRELGRRGIWPGRLDRVVRPASRRDHREGRDAAQRRLGRLRPGARHRRRPLAPRPDARGRRVGPSTSGRAASRSATSGWPSVGPPGRARRRSTSTASGMARPAADDPPSLMPAPRAVPGPEVLAADERRWARGRTTRRSSTTSASPRSTSGSTAGTGSTTRSTTTSTGWRSSAIPSSSPMPRPPGSTP